MLLIHLSTVFVREGGQISGLLKCVLAVLASKMKCLTELFIFNGFKSLSIQTLGSCGTAFCVMSEVVLIIYLQNSAIIRQCQIIKLIGVFARC